MVSKNTGFHPSDADWTKGREAALHDAEAAARMENSLRRPVILLRAIGGEA